CGCILNKLQVGQASLTDSQHRWPQMFIGETIILQCEIQGGEDKEMTYEWKSPNPNIPETSSEYRISRLSVSHSGDYKCRGSSDYLLAKWSDPFTLIVFKPRATLTAQSSIIPAGGSVTLNCSVEGSAGWNVYWFRSDSVSSEIELIREGETNRVISVSQGGLYRCRGGRGDPVSFTEESNEVTITETAKLTAQSLIIPVGGSVTLNCSVNPSSSSGWKYYWYRDENSSEPLTTQDAVFHSNGQISVSQEGLYRCRGGRGNPVYYTEDSQSVRIGKTALNKPTVTLQPSWTQIYSGETVTVRCEIQGGEGAQWTYEWRQNKLNTPPTSNEYRIIRATESDSGGYSCRGRRDYFFSEWSDIITLTVLSASLTVSPDRVQHFTSDSVSLTCVGKFAEGRVRKFSEDGRLYSECRRMTGSTCNINTSDSDTAVYWCESGSGEFSSAVNISLLHGCLALNSGVNDSTSLGTSRLKISAVSKSDEGFYKCQYSGRESAQSWMSVKAKQLSFLQIQASSGWYFFIVVNIFINLQCMRLSDFLHVIVMFLLCHTVQ
uniref:Ig-like domain-containing protein n=1 Tax=Neolamprologus brichardi TaxID=32507 RepID=A0A3Q4GEK8_NEOBR